MEPDRPSFEEQLLDWHLDRLDDKDRSQVEEALGSDPELRAKSDRLGKVLQPLDHWQVAAAPPNLADRVLAGVERATRNRSRILRLPIGDSGSRGVPRPSLRDLIAVAACLALLVGVAVPGVSSVRSHARKTACASNLGSIFNGLSAYRQDFAGSLPFAGSLTDASWLPGGSPKRRYASNSRHLYLLVKMNYGPSVTSFVCPACKNAEPMGGQGCATHSDFARACNVSYDSLNLAGRAPNLRPPMPIPYLSDHRGKGQTVLVLDGSTRWMTTPVFGKHRDNLWLIANIRRYTGTETPSRHDDAQLVPGFPATDPTIRRPGRNVH
jgi:hypothetical protein